jgi:hypothetical protein
VTAATSNWISSEGLKGNFGELRTATPSTQTQMKEFNFTRLLHLSLQVAFTDYMEWLETEKDNY